MKFIIPLALLLTACAPSPAPLDPLDIPIGHPTIHYAWEP